MCRKGIMRKIYIKRSKKIIALIAAAIMTLTAAGCSETGSPGGNGYYTPDGSGTQNQLTPDGSETQTPVTPDGSQNGSDAGSGNYISLSEIPEYSGNPYIEINGNIPDFPAEDYVEEPFEFYSELDSLGRCVQAYANICTDIMPYEERGSIGSVKPTGWQTSKYEFVDGKYLYNRCHLIAYMLTAENANKRNLITGTRYLNIEGMLPFENQVQRYVKTTANHVLYRVTPIYDGNNLVADGVLMEAESVEDNGAGVRFCVFCYNVQPGVEIDYATGENRAAGSGTAQNGADVQMYILNKNSTKFHYPSCGSVANMSSSNKKSFTGTREELIAQGYEPCGSCRP